MSRAHVTLKTKKSQKSKSKPAPVKLILPQPKLLFPTIICLLCVAYLFISTLPPFLPQILSHFASYMLDGILISIALLLVPALAIFLIYRLIEAAIIHRKFHPTYLLSTLAVILSVVVFIDSGPAPLLYLAIYLIAALVSFIYLSLQKSRATFNDPAHFRRSLFHCSIASLILGLVNLLFLIISISALSDPTSPTQVLFFICLFLTLPLQLVFTFLALTKITPTLDAKLFSRRDLHLIYLCLFFAVTTTTAYLAILGTILADEYIDPYQYHTFIE